MKAFGFLSFGHYSMAPGRKPGPREVLHDAIELSERADKIGVNGAYFRVHHFATQGASPMPLLSAVAARTKHIEVGTGVIDLRYENPLYLAEEAAALDYIADARVALGVSRGSPEEALRGWEAFGYTGSRDPRGADIARDKFDRFLEAVSGKGLAAADPAHYGAGLKLPVLPHSPGLRQRIWWGAGTRETAEWAAEKGVNLMSSTLLTETHGAAFADLQAEQIERFRKAWNHDFTPRVSVSRTIFPLVTAEDHQFFGQHAQSNDQIGSIDGFTSTFGRTYAAEPDKLIEQLRNDAAVMSADTLMLTIPNQLGPDINFNILKNFAEHVAPALGWQPNTAGPVTGYPLR